MHTRWDYADSERSTQTLQKLKSTCTGKKGKGKTQNCTHSEKQICTPPGCMKKKQKDANNKSAKQDKHIEYLHILMHTDTQQEGRHTGTVCLLLSLSLSLQITHLHWALRKHCIHLSLVVLLLHYSIFSLYLCFFSSSLSLRWVWPLHSFITDCLHVLSLNVCS